MKFKQLQAESKESLQKRLKEVHLELMKLKAQVATGTAQKESGKIRNLKRMIAQIKTIQNTKPK
jgi:ribosomal protein L29